jgi:hypothetical protein
MIVAIIQIVIILALLAMTIFKTEKFFSDDYYPKNINATFDTAQMLSNGTIQKTLMKDGEYLYDYFYNLPTPTSEFHIVRPGTSFNQKIPKRNYEVFAGDSKDSTKKIGELSRRGDGYFVFTAKTKENYKTSCIVLDGNVIHCVNL